MLLSVVFVLLFLGGSYFVCTIHTHKNSFTQGLAQLNTRNLIADNEISWTFAMNSIYFEDLLGPLVK